jgi:hypothetical protein
MAVNTDLKVYFCLQDRKKKKEETTNALKGHCRPPLATLYRAQKSSSCLTFTISESN